MFTKMKQYAYCRRNIYVALEDVPDADFFWDEKEINTFELLWHKDVPLSEIGEILSKTELSVLFLAMDRLLNEKIKPRKGWYLW